MKRIVLAALVLVLLTGCKPFMRVFYGVSNPKVENEETLTRYMEKKGIHAENVYALGFESWGAALKRIDNSIPDVLIFNRQGQFIPYGDEWACNASAFSFIEELHKDSTYRSSDQITLEDAFTSLHDLKGTYTVFEDNPYADFYVFIYWAKWAGKLNKDHALVWEQQARENPHAQIEVVKVNMDLQEFWGEENLRKLERNTEY